jgi:hypothetical protein
VVVAVDQFLARGRFGTAVAYLLASIVAGLAAGAGGLLIGRMIAVRRRRSGDGRPAAEGGRA